jgi:hypothetical protein
MNMSAMAKRIRVLASRTPLRKDRIAAGLIVVACAVAPGCSGCKGKAPLNYVPQDAAVVLVVPGVGQALTDAKLLLDKFRDQTPVKMGLEAGKAQVVKELGFDPENPESMKTKGIDPSGGLVASLGSDGKSVAIAFGVEDQKLLEKLLRELAGKMTGGAATFVEKDVGGARMTLLQLPGGNDPRAAWTYVGKHIVICPAAKDGKVADYLAQVTKLEANIKRNKTFSAVESKIGKYHALVYADGAGAKKMQAARNEERLKGASEWMRKYIKERQDATDGFMAYFEGGALALRLSAEGATLRGYTAIPSDKGKTIREIFKGTGDAVDLAKFIGPDALAVGRFSIDGKKLMDRMLELMPPAAKRGFYAGVERIERDLKLSVEKDVLALLAGRYAGAVFAPPADAIKAGPPRGMSDAVRFLSLVGMAQVTDTQKAADLLVKLERMMVMAHVDVKTRTEGDRKVYSIDSDGRTLVAWTVVKNVVVVGTGDRLAKTVALVTGGGDNVLSTVDSSRAKSLLKSPEGIVLYYNVAKTADTVRAMDLPAELKAILSTALTTVSKFSDVTVSWEVEDEGVLGELAVRVK